MAAKKRKRKRRRDSLVLKLIIMVTLVLIVFEGRLVVTMVKHHSAMNETVVTDGVTANGSAKGTLEKDEDSDSGKTEQSSGADVAADHAIGSVLAGLPTAVSSGKTLQTTAAPETSKKSTVSKPDSEAIVRQADTPVDDSYFSDAAFIGDSRMQGFQNASGITQGKFFTSVGMSLSKMKSEKIIQDGGENITVAAALSGGNYNKIYIMLGANDLGEYDWDSFRDGFISCTQRFREIQPNAVIYVCSVIYVEESKITSGSYVNNTNVDTINSILLEICEQEGYYYLDLNEILSNGHGSLIEGASSDGVHVYPEYCEKMLSYMKSHYVEVEGKEAASAEEQDGEETESETEESPDAS